MGGVPLAVVDTAPSLRACVRCRAAGDCLALAVLGQLAQPRRRAACQAAVSLVVVPRCRVR